MKIKIFLSLSLLCFSLQAADDAKELSLESVSGRIDILAGELGGFNERFDRIEKTLNGLNDRFAPKGDYLAPDALDAYVTTQVFNAQCTQKTQSVDDIQQLLDKKIEEVKESTKLTGAEILALLVGKESEEGSFMGQLAAELVPSLTVPGSSVRNSLTTAAAEDKDAWNKKHPKTGVLGMGSRRPSLHADSTDTAVGGKRKQSLSQRIGSFRRKSKASVDKTVPTESNEDGASFIAPSDHKDDETV